MSGGFRSMSSGFMLSGQDVAPVADFTGTPLTGSPTLIVNFTNTTPKNMRNQHLWEYDGGGGWTNFSTASNPSFGFGNGTYSIRLTETNNGGSNTKTRTDYVVSSSPWTPADLTGKQDFWQFIDANVTTVGPLITQCAQSYGFSADGVLISAGSTYDTIKGVTGDIGFTSAGAGSIAFSANATVVLWGESAGGGLPVDCSGLIGNTTGAGFWMAGPGNGGDTNAWGNDSVGPSLLIDTTAGTKFVMWVSSKSGTAKLRTTGTTNTQSGAIAQDATWNQILGTVAGTTDGTQSYCRGICVLTTGIDPIDDAAGVSFAAWLAAQGYTL